MKRIFLPICIALLSLSSMTHANEIMSLFLRSYPKAYDQTDASVFATKLGHPTKMARSTLKNTFNAYPLAGVLATYAGYLAVSDTTGQFIFPRRHEAASIHIVITPMITPILMMSNTIHHWELEIGTPAVMYLIERKYDNDTNLTYWQTTSLELPENNEIPLEAMIIFDRPQDIYVPLGITIIQQSPNFVLPDIYLKSAQTAAEQALYILNMRFFFGSLDHLFKKQPKSYIEQIAP